MRINWDGLDMRRLKSNKSDYINSCRENEIERGILK